MAENTWAGHGAQPHRKNLGKSVVRFDELVVVGGAMFSEFTSTPLPCKVAL